MLNCGSKGKCSRPSGILRLLDLNELATGGIPAITPALGASLAEAAGVCLESQGHSPGVALHVRGDSRTSYALAWPAISAQSLRAWNDPEEATEYGASAIAILLAKREIGYEVIRRSHNGTGFDYWLGDVTSEGFQDKAGLEISGIRRGRDSIVNARVEEKLRQARRSRLLRLPVYVIVVEFGRPLAEVRKDERPE